LLPIIQLQCEAGSVIHSDEWAAYRCLNSSGYIHNTVNQRQNYVVPSPSADTHVTKHREIKAECEDKNSENGKKHYPSLPQLLRSHLDHYC